MDLNRLYSDHQLTLMRAAATTSALARTKLLAAADLIGHRIGVFQQSQQASAASGWLRAANGMA